MAQEILYYTIMALTGASVHYISLVFVSSYAIDCDLSSLLVTILLAVVHISDVQPCF